MKKIVALVLSLVMVMGLAVTAFAFSEDAEYVLKSVDGATVEGRGLTFVPGEDNGDGTGTVDAFMDSVDTYVVVEKKYADYAIWDGDMPGDQRLAYVKAQTNEYDDTAKKVAASLYATCSTDANAKGYLSVDAYGVKTYYADSTTSGDYIMVDGKMTQVDLMGGVVLGGHALAKYKAAAKDAAETVYEYKCVVCGATFDAVEGGNKAAGVTYIPYATPAATVTYYGNAGYDVTGVVSSTTGAPVLWLVATASAPAVDGDKVESAETFDAGIAMYVGMSVMAAAGSAVVLKKKD